MASVAALSGGWLTLEWVRGMPGSSGMSCGEVRDDEASALSGGAWRRAFWRGTRRGLMITTSRISLSRSSHRLFGRDWIPAHPLDMSEVLTCRNNRRKHSADVSRLIPKLIVRVRFPSPAPTRNPRSESTVARRRYCLRKPRAYRVIYRIDDRACVVTVVDIGHRRDIYRIRPACTCYPVKP
jgi:hypothetical protein